MTQQLNASLLAAVKTRGIATPAYARHELRHGVVHLGLGAFHRAHQALVFDALLAQSDTRWGIFGVAMRSTALADALNAQNGLYAVQIASRDGIGWRVPGALLRTAVAARERASVVEAIAAPSTRWITLTVTEKGYGPDVIDLIVDGLAQRHAAGLPGLTIASCDNLSDNGRKLQALCTAAAQTHNAPLAAWIAASCAFPNSMVDRIVPAATPARLAAAREALGMDDAAALGTEGFWEWVIEQRFVDDGDAALLASVGVTVVDDVHPFENAKLRMLNGCHSAMACIGAVAGLAVIADCINQPSIRTLVHGLMTIEISPHVTRPDWQSYRDALLARFSNPELMHSVHQIAMDSSQKIPQRWPPVILGQLQAGDSIERLAFAAAGWVRYCLGTNERGEDYVIADPIAEQVQTLARAHQGDSAATVSALLGLESIWGRELPQNETWVEHVAHRLTRINASGILPALVELNVELV